MKEIHFKSVFKILILLLTFIVEISFVYSQTPDRFDQEFVTPPKQFKPRVLWQWMGGMISREGIVKDLKAMHEQGIGGVMIMQLPDQCPYPYQWSFSDYPGHVKTLSNEWFSLINFAIVQADELDMDVSIFICPGWSQAGGPMVSDKNALKLLNSSSIVVNGPCEISCKLPDVSNKENYSNGNYTPQWLPARIFKTSDFRKDISVLAFPDNTQKILKKNEIIDVSGNVNNEGVLKWQVPEGKWIVKRITLVPENGYNQPAPVESIGFECDRMDTSAVNQVFDAIVKRITIEAREKGLRSFKGFETDSYEGGNQDFGNDFVSQFALRRGYDCTKWLPAWIDRSVIIESENLTCRFINDMKKTISELWQERYYAHLQRLADRYQLNWHLQPYWGVELDWLSIAGVCGYPGNEFWTRKSNLTGAASEAAALYNKKTIWAEAFTSESWESAWRLTPFELKLFADYSFAKGVNMLYMHGFVHNPFSDKYQPGVTMSYWGTQLSRHLTWWKFASDWHTYLARCQYMLHKGKPVCDFLLYPSVIESVPKMSENVYGEAVLTDDVLMNRLTVKNGMLFLPHNVSFKALILKDNHPVTPEYLGKIYQLVLQGAILIGNRPPDFSVSLKNYPYCDSSVVKISDKIWGKIKSSGKREIKLGKGKVLAGYSLDEAQKIVAGKPDFNFTTLDTIKTAPDILFNHRSNDSVDIYYITNQQDIERNLQFSLKTKYSNPEWWNPVNGERIPLKIQNSANGFLTLNLVMAAKQCGFVVFFKYRKSNSKKNEPLFEKQNEIRLEGKWKITFASAINGINKTFTDSLFDWTTHSDKNVKYYSGIVSYSKSFVLPKVTENVYLKLDKVYNLANVKINNTNVGTIWCAPWIIHIPREILKEGDNTVEIEVCNTWVNRLIGDEQEVEYLEYVDITGHLGRKGGYVESIAGSGLKDLPLWITEGKENPIQGRKTFSTWKFYNKEASLQTSGLLGTVSVFY